MSACDLTADEARRLFYYDPSTGMLTWSLDRNQNVKAGDQVGWVHEHSPYRRARVNGKRYFAHRIIWLMAYGEWPKNEIDHIDGDSLNNRMDNLREVDRTENMRNTKRCSVNTSGQSGVHRHTQSGKWNARIRTNGRRVSLGLFEKKEEAVQARKEAERLHGYHPNHGTNRGVFR